MDRREESREKRVDRREQSREKRGELREERKAERREKRKYISVLLGHYKGEPGSKHHMNDIK